MAIRPILFGSPMVLALLENAKTQTRRVMQPQPDSEGYLHAITNLGAPSKIYVHDKGVAPHQSGDILWVRETWMPCLSDGGYLYRASVIDPNDGIWKPSIFMPKVATRIFLVVTDVRAERVQEISEVDAIAEGTLPEPLGKCDYHNSCLECGSYTYNKLGAHKDNKLRDDCHYTAVENYAFLWDDLNAKRGYGWSVNPWVWAYTFGQCAKPAGWPAAA